MRLWPTTVRDDRGRRITLSLGSDEANRRLKVHHSRLEKQWAEQTRKREALDRKKPTNIWLQRLRDWPSFLVFACAGMLGGIGFLAGLVLGASAPLIGVAMLLGWDWRVGVVATIAIAIMVAVVMGFRRRDAGRHERAKRLVAIGTCGACGYSLENLELADDGFLQCPECGAAWNKIPPHTECAGCKGPLHSLTVNPDGSANCPGCGQLYAIAPSIAGPSPAPSAI